MTQTRLLLFDHLAQPDLLLCLQRREVEMGLEGEKEVVVAVACRQWQPVTCNSFCFFASASF